MGGVSGLSTGNASDCDDAGGVGVVCDDVGGVGVTCDRLVRGFGTGGVTIADSAISLTVSYNLLWRNN